MREDFKDFLDGNSGIDRASITKIENALAVEGKSPVIEKPMDAINAALDSEAGK